MNRAGPLAAVALVVTNRAEPIATLRRLVAEDRDLRPLNPVIDHLESGHSLPEALRRAGLLRRTEADGLANLKSEDLSAALGQLARRVAEPSPGQALLRWFPLWALLAATGPSLLISATVAVGAGSIYHGLLELFTPPMLETNPVAGAAPMTVGWWFFVQAGAVGVTALIVAGLCAGLPRVKGLWRFLPPDRPTARATALVNLLSDLHQGRACRRSWKRWCWFSGLGEEARWGLQQMAGNHRATVLGLGLVPIQDRGEPDFPQAIVEAGRVQAQAAAHARPLAIGLLAMAGILGLLGWNGGLQWVIIQELWWQDPWHHLVRNGLGMPIAVAAGATVLLWVFGWLRVAMAALVEGPATDWPLVALRVAQAIERRDDLTRALHHLQAWTGWAMGRRLAQARTSDEPHPGRRLVAAGVVPASLAQTLSTTSTEALPAVLRGSVAVEDDLLDHRVRGQVVVSLVILLLLGAILTSCYGTLTRTYAYFFRHPFLSADLAVQTLAIALLLVGGALLGLALARRFGWDLWWTGHRRLAEGLRLRQALALRQPEAALGPGADLPDILHRAGWACRTPADLDRALAADQHRRRWATHRRTVIVALVLPFLIGLPTGLIWTSVIVLSQETNRLHAAWGPTPLGGGSLVWWTLHQHRELAEQRAQMAGAPEMP